MMKPPPSDLGTFLQFCMSLKFVSLGLNFKRISSSFADDVVPFWSFQYVTPQKFNIVPEDP